jgi:hypothetical protein
MSWLTYPVRGRVLFLAHALPTIVLSICFSAPLSARNRLSSFVGGWGTPYDTSKQIRMRLWVISMDGDTLSLEEHEQSVQGWTNAIGQATRYYPEDMRSAADKTGIHKLKWDSSSRTVVLIDILPAGADPKYPEMSVTRTTSLRLGKKLNKTQTLQVFRKIEPSDSQSTVILEELEITFYAALAVA